MDYFADCPPIHVSFCCGLDDNCGGIYQAPQGVRDGWGIKMNAYFHTNDNDVTM